MRIGLIRRKYDQSGGAELSLRLLADGFLKNNHQVAVMAQSWQGPAPAGMEFYRIDARRGRVGGLYSFARNAFLQMQGLQLDTCLSLERVPGVSFFRAGDGCHMAWLERRARYEKWYKRHTFMLNPLHRAQLCLEKETMLHPDMKIIIANSHMVAEEVKKYYGLDDAKIRVVYNPVDEKRLLALSDSDAGQSLREELALDGSARVLLFLGSGFARKGLAFIIRALRFMPGVVLLVAGYGRSGAYERLARKEAVNGRVKFLGLRSDVERLLAACQALVLPTIYDPCANVCLEALAAGKPVVTTYSNGACELVENGVNGFLLAMPEDARELAQACLKALDLPGPVSAELNSKENWLLQISRAIGVE